MKRTLKIVVVRGPEWARSRCLFIISCTLRGGEVSECGGEKALHDNDTCLKEETAICRKKGSSE